MPVSKSPPHAWYDTPNIHLSTFRDFGQLCRDKGLTLVDQRAAMAITNRTGRRGCGPTCSAKPRSSGSAARVTGVNRWRCRARQSALEDTATRASAQCRRARRHGPRSRSCHRPVPRPLAPRRAAASRHRPGRDARPATASIPVCHAKQQHRAIALRHAGRQGLQMAAAALAHRVRSSMAVMLAQGDLLDPDIGGCVRGRAEKSRRASRALCVS